MATLPPTSRASLRTAALAVSLTLAACGSTSSTSSRAGTHAASSTRSEAAAKAPLHGGVHVSISNYAYRPATLTVTAGTRVTFTNHDQTAHTATSTGTGFDTRTLAPGRGATVTLNKPGTYTYYCQFHAFMRGTVIVR